MSNSEALFNEFNGVSDQEWRDKIISDLKGKDFENTLVWEDENQIKHQPFYHSLKEENAGLIQKIQAAQKQDISWKIIQQFPADSKKLKKLVNEALKNGVDAVVIKDVLHSKETKEVLGNDLKDSNQVHLHLLELHQNNIPKSYFSDPIGEMIQSGRKSDADLDSLKGIFQKRLNQLKPDNFLVVDGSIYKNAGATVVQELAYTLHHALEYLDVLTDAGYTAEAVARSFTFKLGFGTSFFSEISKARAFRYLIKKLFKAYKVRTEVKLWGEASTFYHAHKDAHTNLLRLSTQCMSMVLGNCDLISLPSFDELEESSTLGYRMSKNIPLVLKNESYFEQVKDIAAGSFYVENLTAEVVEKSWEAFLSMEKKGGLFQQLEDKSLLKEIQLSKDAKIKTYQDGNKVIVGVNKYLNQEGTTLKVNLTKTDGLSSTVISKELEA